MRFTDAQKQQFKQNGYLIVEGFFDKHETNAMQAEVDRLKAEGILSNVSTKAGKANLQLCPMSPHSELFRTLPFAPKVREAVSELIGDPVVLHLDQVFLKPANHGSGTNWHQDNAYFKLDDPMMGTALWAAVHDANVDNGTLRVIPGSGNEKMEHSRDPESNHHIRCYPNEEDAIPAVMKAGGVIFFAYGVAHATGANKTSTDRAGAAFHFLNGQAVGTDYFEPKDGKMKHPYITGPKYDGGVEAYGEVLEGTWNAVVERSLSTAVHPHINVPAVI
jgi:phytanoyl-CoA hydroxylase